MFTHRLYLGQGVCGDLTLLYQDDSFQPLPWTYPDYAHAEIRTFFAWLRKILHLKMVEGLQPYRLYGNVSWKIESQICQSWDYD